MLYLALFQVIFVHLHDAFVSVSHHHFDHKLMAVVLANPLVQFSISFILIIVSVSLLLKVHKDFCTKAVFIETHQPRMIDHEFLQRPAKEGRGLPHHLVLAQLVSGDKVKFEESVRRPRQKELCSPLERSDPI